MIAAAPPPGFLRATVTVATKQSLPRMLMAQDGPMFETLQSESEVIAMRIVPAPDGAFS